MSLLLNLQQRHVFRAVAWYAGVAWLAIEVSNTVFPQFGLPDWSVRAVIVVAMLGLPIVVALAWWLDLSRLGLRREQALPEGLASAQVTPGQPALVARALHELWVVPEPRGNLEAALADLQRALEISPNDAEAHDVAAVTRTLNALERARLVRRERSVSARRMVLVHATAKARRLMEAGRERRVGRIAAGLGSLNSEELELLSRASKLLEKLG